MEVLEQMKKTFRARTAKAISAVLVAAFTFTLIPMALGQNAVVAATAITKDQSNTRLGVSDIAGPSAPNNGWNGSYVYFGHNGTGGNEIKFRVLDPNSDKYGGNTLFLDSDETLFQYAFDNDSNDWGNSDLKSYLNGTFLIGGSFTGPEQDAIFESKIDGRALNTESGAYAKGIYTGYIGLTGEKIFILDAEEASTAAYGYSNIAGSCSDRIKGGSIDYWWLRSAYSEYGTSAGYVSSDGRLASIRVTTDFSGVAPALNINQKSIIFNTAIENEANAYKLTLSDSNLIIAVPAGQNVTVTGTTITVPYAISGTNAGTATRASILITDKAWNESDANIILYGELGASTASSGTFILPSGYDLDGWGTDYHVYILAEDINDVKETDYASEPVEIMPQTYTVTYKVANGTWSDGSTDAVTETVIKDLSPASIPTGMIASSGYEGGSWDTDPSKASISADTTFTYTFDAVPTYTVTVQSDGNGKASVDVTSGAKGTEVTLTATPDSGYQFKEWQVVSGGVTVTDNKFTIGTSDVTVKAVFEAELTVPAANTYSVIKGADGTWDGKSDYVVEVKSSTDDEHCIDRFMWAAVDGHELKVGEECELAVGSTIVIIKSDYLKTLGAGTHNIVVNFTDNSVATKLTINAASTSAGASVPSTGEIISPAFWIGSSSVAAGMLFAIVLIQKKRKSAQR